MEYVSTSNQPKIEQTWRQTAFLLVFFALTPLVLMVIGKLAIKETFDGDLATYQKVTKLLYGGTILLGLLVVALRRVGLAFLTRGHNAVNILKKLQMLALLGAGLGELIGILGFVALLITHDYQFCWRLGIVSLLVILYSFPRRWEWERAIASVE